MAAHKPHKITWPLTPKSADDIEKMFRELYQKVNDLENLATGSSQTAKQLTRTVLRD